MAASGHRKYSMSGSHQWILGHCPASVRMSEGYPEIITDYAERGTAAHAAGEFCIEFGLNPSDLLGMKFNDIEVDHKMIDDVSIYTGYMNQRALFYREKPRIEVEVLMTSLGRTDVGGTSDGVFISLSQRTLEIDDYKNGYGVVEVLNNSQLIGYAISTLDTFELWDKIDTIITTVIQPNSNHKDGPVRSCTYNIAQMRYWRDIFKQSIILSEDKTQKPNAGEWCYWCKAQANCRARIEWVLEHAYINVPFEELSEPELEAIYNEISGISAFLEKVKDRVFSLACKGRKFEGYKVVQSFGRAECKDETGLVQAASVLGKTKDDLYHPGKLKSKTDMKRILPANLVNQFFISPEPGKKLVPMDDRAPALSINNAVDAFKDFKLEKK